MQLTSSNSADYIAWALKNLNEIDDVMMVMEHIYRVCGFSPAYDYLQKLKGERLDKASLTLALLWAQNNYVDIDTMKSRLSSAFKTVLRDHDIGNHLPDSIYHPLKECARTHIYRYAQRSPVHRSECRAYIPLMHSMFYDANDAIDWHAVMKGGIKKNKIDFIVSEIKNKECYWESVTAEDIKVLFQSWLSHTPDERLIPIFENILNQRSDLCDVYYQEIVNQARYGVYKFEMIHSDHPLLDEFFDILNNLNTKNGQYKMHVEMRGDDGSCNSKYMKNNIMLQDVSSFLRLLKILGPKVERLKHPEHHVTSFYEEVIVLRVLEEAAQTQGCTMAYWLNWFDNKEYYVPNIYLLNFLYHAKEIQSYNMFAEKPIEDALIHIVEQTNNKVIQTLDNFLEKKGLRYSDIERYMVSMEELGALNVLTELEILRSITFIARPEGEALLADEWCSHISKRACRDFFMKMEGTEIPLLL